MSHDNGKQMPHETIDELNGAQSSHPNAVRLESLAVGETDQEARSHLATCAACASYVEAVSQQAAAFAREKAAEADAFMRGVRMRAEPTPLASPRRGDATKRKSSTWVAGGATFFAAAACLLLVVRGRISSVDHPKGTGTGAADVATKVEMDPSQGPTRLKGAVSFNVVVDRDGVQIRQSGPPNLVPGDRIRIELALAEGADLAAGVLSEDGEWGELQPPIFFPAGTHFSERDVFFKDEVPNGWILVGQPAAIERARKTRNFTGLVAVRVQGRRR